MNPGPLNSQRSYSHAGLLGNAPDVVGTAALGIHCILAVGHSKTVLLFQLRSWLLPVVCVFSSLRHVNVLHMSFVLAEK